MIETLQSTSTNALIDEHTDRTKWVQNWPGQVVLAVNMIRWTRGAEFSILNGRPDNIKEDDERIK